MKTRTTGLNINSIALFIVIAIITALLSSCDVMEPDADVLEPRVELQDDEVYVLSNNTAFIDLASRIKTTKPVRLSITSTTKHGELTDIGQGLLQYTPSAGDQKLIDAFTFTAFAENDAIIKVDTVVIVVENDSTHLPCGIFTNNDYVYGVQKRVPVRIRVLANDYICSADSSDLVVSIFRPNDSLPPKHGTAEVNGTDIIYTASNTFTSQDKLIYKIYGAGNEQNASYGIVFLTGGSACRVSPRNDIFTISQDSLKSVVRLPVFQNDSLCESLNQYQVSISKAPSKGSVSVNQFELTYQVYETASVTPTFADFFFYQVCIDGTCKTARVDLRARKDSTTACTLKAKADIFHISGDPIDARYLDVLANDSTCDGYSIFRVTEQPATGSASIEDNGILYRPHANASQRDSLEYEICNTALCSRAKVLITIQK